MSHNQVGSGEILISLVQMADSGTSSTHTRSACSSCRSVIAQKPRNIWKGSTTTWATVFGISSTPSNGMGSDLTIRTSSPRFSSGASFAESTTSRTRSDHGLLPLRSNELQPVGTPQSISKRIRLSLKYPYFEAYVFYHSNMYISPM